MVSALVGCGIVGCGGSTDPHNGQIVGAPGQTGTGGGGAPTTTGSGGSGGLTGPAPGSTIFAENYGDEGEQFLAGLATDASGNVYVAGNEMPVNIAVPGTPESQLAMQGTQSGVFLLQYSSTGVLMWRQPFVPAANCHARVRRCRRAGDDRPRDCRGNLERVGEHRRHGVDLGQ